MYANVRELKHIQDIRLHLLPLTCAIIVLLCLCTSMFDYVSYFPSPSIQVKEKTYIVLTSPNLYVNKPWPLHVLFLLFLGGIMREYAYINICEHLPCTSSLLAYTNMYICVHCYGTQINCPYIRKIYLQADSAHKNRKIRTYTVCGGFLAKSSPLSCQVTSI